MQLGAALGMKDGFYSQAIHQAGLCQALEPLLTPQTPQAPTGATTLQSMGMRHP